MQAMDRLKPERVCVDSVTQLRYLSPDPHQFRKQMMALARYLTGQGRHRPLHLGSEPRDPRRRPSVPV